MHEIDGIRWLITFVLIAMLAGLQGALWLSATGYQRVRELRIDITMQSTINKKLAERNAVLLAEVNDLKHGLFAIEELARSELGMVKRGEHFYQIVE